MTDFHDSTGTPVDMPKLHIINNTVYTTSIEVADYFGKRHDNVLRVIDNLGCSEKFNTLNFEVVEYIDNKGEKRRMYRMTRDGFTLVAMGFTSKKAVLFKEAYIEAFNKMECLLYGDKQSFTTDNQQKNVPEPADVLGNALTSEFESMDNALTLKTETDLMKLQVMLAREIERCQNPVIQTALTESFERVCIYLKQSPLLFGFNEQNK